MGDLVPILVLFVFGAVAVHLITAALVSGRARWMAGPETGAGQPPVSLLRPLCGLEHALEETLASSFALDYAQYEVIFCVEHPDDPAIPLARRLIERNPGVPAQLLIGADPISGNPKLNNLVKGWKAAQHDWIVMSDSNVLLPPDFLDAAVARFDAHTGLVSSPPVGIRPQNAWGALECGFLNTYQARWQLAADTLGLGFAQGKTLFWRRAVAEAGGGLEQLGREMAEDVASTKLVRAQGLHVRLVPVPFPQPIGSRRLADVWSRQVRWARVRRLGFPLIFAGEILTGVLPPLLALAVLAAHGSASWIWLPVLAALWFAAEWGMAQQAGWPASARDVGMWMLRDAMLPAVWVAAWAGRGFTWRGTQMDAAGPGGLPTAK